MLEKLDYTIRIGSTPTFLYFDCVSLSFGENGSWDAQSIEIEAACSDFNKYPLVDSWIFIILCRVNSIIL